MPDLPLEVWEWIADPDRWAGSRGIPSRVLEHLWYSLSSLAAAIAIALPVGLWVGHTGRGGTLAINLANTGRAVPSFGIIVLFAILIGFGFTGTFIALVAFAIPPILTNTYTGVREVNSEVRESAEGMGMRGFQVLWRVEVPYALPLIFAGIRTSAVQVIATATLANLVGIGGLGSYVFGGLARLNFAEMLVGAVLVALLSLAMEGVLALVQRAVVPGGLQEQEAATQPAQQIPSPVA
ncbi:ABC transporter permease [Egibacter rhizosphaerae]|uniref:ABC transporter permease n=1 Tax=Egibacter rhizosphaerae TaxID=1670831 RepID=A0A411YAS4_9ACTN|nr:ABC transporter permease [Egibacter rhizosphaerae]QBI18320.1 ABC transporter permease [Egibacter rhizosphaerae]